MRLEFQHNGSLKPGIHKLTFEEFEEDFGFNPHRKALIVGLKIGIEELRECGCTKIYIDGSFTTRKETPTDFDACWDVLGVDLPKLKTKFPTMLDFSNHRENQKKRYKGEFFPAQASASPYNIYLDFFQKDRDGNKKGIIEITLN
ncbi:hypothetical protein J0A67_19585 [Algoriphagus aestuariicola]|uniref:Uncharacterized protein n=1 Tax=Algoriphagus aestuariicola TaxID=1852016 RepID=A0ABS3BXL9_9BACT|nr:hypothetical protein [Algoriphagus aestuariicola]MBN7803085.1 hypothetical protein [Algoriphagus aestuariicola]